MTSTKLVPVRTSCDLPIATVTMAVWLAPLIWMTRLCARASPTIHSSAIANARLKAIARSRSQAPDLAVLSDCRQSKPATSFLLLFTTLSPPNFD